MKKLIIALSLLLVGLITLSGQREETLFGDLDFSGAWGGTKVNFTAFGDDFTVFKGGWGGLEFNKDFFIGWGGFSSDDDFRLPELPDNEFSMRYNGLMLGYGFNSHKALHPKFAMLIGGGRIEMDDIDRDQLFVLQPSLGVELNIFRWFRLGLNGGYRIVADTDIPGLTDQALSAPFTQLVFKFGYSWGRRNW